MALLFPQLMKAQEKNITVTQKTKKTFIDTLERTTKKPVVTEEAKDLAAFEKVMQLQRVPPQNTLPPLSNPCTNGDFENNSLASWQGLLKNKNPNSQSNLVALYPQNMPGFTAQCAEPASYSSLPFTVQLPFVYANTNFTSHQSITLVGRNLDPNGNFYTTHSGNKAVKLGTEFPVTERSFRANILRKRFVVDASSCRISFWHAMVMRAVTSNYETGSGHFWDQQAYFYARIVDENGKLIRNITSRMALEENENINYPIQYTTRSWDWQYASADLTDQIGKTVYLELISKACYAGGHFGYAYVDDICGECDGSKSGCIRVTGISKDCGASPITVNTKISFPFDNNGNTNQRNSKLVSLSIRPYKNGLPIGQAYTVSSGIYPASYNAVTDFSFTVIPALLGIPQLTDNVDLVVSASFNYTVRSFGGLGGQTTTTYGNESVSSHPAGLTPGFNNDFALACACHCVRWGATKVTRQSPYAERNNIPLYFDASQTIYLYPGEGFSFNAALVCDNNDCSKNISWKLLNNNGAMIASGTNASGILAASQLPPGLYKLKQTGSCGALNPENCTEIFFPVKVLSLQEIVCQPEPMGPTTFNVKVDRHFSPNVNDFTVVLNENDTLRLPGVYDKFTFSNAGFTCNHPMCAKNIEWTIIRAGSQATIYYSGTGLSQPTLIPETGFTPGLYKLIYTTTCGTESKTYTIWIKQR